jgi:hypothetical protein
MVDAIISGKQSLRQDRWERVVVLSCGGRVKS